MTVLIYVDSSKQVGIKKSQLRRIARDRTKHARIHVADVAVSQPERLPISSSCLRTFTASLDSAREIGA